MSQLPAGPPLAWLVGAAQQPTTHSQGSWASRDLLTSLDGQEVVQFMQQLQQGFLLLGLTELKGHRTGGQQGWWVRGEYACLALPR